VADHDLTGPLNGAPVPLELLEALARGVAAALAPQPASSGPEQTTDFLTAGQFALRLGVSRETVRRLAIANVLPFTVVCRGSRKTTRRYPRRFADEFAASGLDVTDLAEFAAQWRARMASAGQ
jgi:excisionase family DNA binding protein